MIKKLLTKLELSVFQYTVLYSLNIDLITWKFSINSRQLFSGTSTSPRRNSDQLEITVSGLLIHDGTTGVTLERHFKIKEPKFWFYKKQNNFKSLIHNYSFTLYTSTIWFTVVTSQYLGILNLKFLKNYLISIIRKKIPDT